MPEHNAKILESIVLGVLDKHAPLKRKVVKGFQSPWFTNNLIKQCNERDKLRKKAATDETFILIYKKFQNKLNNAIRAAKKHYFNKKLARIKNSSDAWRIMNDLIQFKNKSNPKITK